MQVRCADMENPGDFDGFQIALWREVAQDMGWAPEDWTFTCVDWTEMIDDLTSPDGLCSFAAAGGCSRLLKATQLQLAGAQGKSGAPRCCKTVVWWSVEVCQAKSALKVGRGLA
jgi:hypothetical protein